MQRAYGRHRRRIKTRPRFWALVFLLAFALGIFAGVMLYADLRPYSAAREEYDALRLSFAPDTVEGTPDTPGVAAAQGIQEPETDAPATGPAAVNPDYVGWLRVEGADVDYPVAQGEDNVKYLTTSFSGEENKLGTIFMDSRCAGSFDAPYTILYGHNAKDGSMFGSLSRCLDADYRREHPVIEITTAAGETLTYRILTAQVTDIYDEAFRLPGADADKLAAFAKSIGATYEGVPLLTLSTCTDYGGRDKRLLVHAALVE